jgi:hypothetical protein
MREDAGALALRGVAMAQLGEDRAAQRLLGRAERGLARADPMRARVIAARGELALAARDLALAGRLLETAEAALASDRVNRTFVRLVRVRRLLLLGRVEDASELMAIDLRGAPAKLRVHAELLRADIAARRLRSLEAEAAVARARIAARSAAIPPLSVLVENAATEVRAPIARLLRDGTTELATLAAIESLAHDDALVIDACRHELRLAGRTVTLATRQLLFALARALGEVAPAAQSRALLIERVFGVRRTSDSLRARLRVELGRLRRVLAPLGLAIDATPEGFVLRGERIVVVLPPADGEASLLLALLRGGEAWSSSALASASGLGKRAVQRALAELKHTGKVDSHGAGRSRRWVARPPDGFAMTLLLNTRPTSR